MLAQSHCHGSVEYFREPLFLFLAKSVLFLMDLLPKRPTQQLQSLHHQQTRKDVIFVSLKLICPLSLYDFLYKPLWSIWTAVQHDCHLLISNV